MGERATWRAAISVYVEGLNLSRPDFSKPEIRSNTLRRFASLLDPMDDAALARLAEESALLTRRHFGRTIRLFAPLYVSNECINTCAYCGFSRDNPILRVTLEVDEVLREARHLVSEGFRHVLLVAGEHPKFVSNGYLEACVRALVPEVPSVALEVAPMDVTDYAAMVRAGAEALVAYQETYDPVSYARLHTAGPKRDYARRLACPERAYEAGFRRIGIGALLGLQDWRSEAISLAAHLEYLLRHCWKAQFTVSFPRLRPCAGGFTPTVQIPDRNFIQIICAFRVCFPQAGIVLSTREPAALRDVLVPLGITMMSAGSHTEPGGYTGQGSENLHLTVRGRRVEVEPTLSDGVATRQFEISDERSPAEIAAFLAARGFEPVWKDWDRAILER